MNSDKLKVNYCSVDLNDSSVPKSSYITSESVKYDRISYSEFVSQTTTPGTTEEKNVSTLKEGVLRICVLSDSHGEHGRLGILPPCDILVHAGDIYYKSRRLDATEIRRDVDKFNEWIGKQPATYKIVIGGNHDKGLLDLANSHFFKQAQFSSSKEDHVKFIQQNVLTNAIYLYNTSVQLFDNTFTVVGSPMSDGQGSSNQAFQDRHFINESRDYFKSLAETKTKIDLLITHGPCQDVGRLLQPTIAHIFGHIHEDYGVRKVYCKVETTSSEPDVVVPAIQDTVFSSLMSNVMSNVVTGSGTEKRSRSPESDGENRCTTLERRSNDAIEEKNGEEEVSIVLLTVDSSSSSCGVTVDEEAVVNTAMMVTGSLVEKYKFWHRLCACIMTEDFEPSQLPLLVDFRGGKGGVV